MLKSRVLSRDDSVADRSAHADLAELVGSTVTQRDCIPTARGAREKMVLLFHGVGYVPPGVPTEESPYWISRSSFLEIVALVKSVNFEREVVLTFDDGNRSDVFVANELVRAGLRGHFFLLAGRLGAPGFLDAAAARDISRAGMEIGLHGHSHVDWRRNSPIDWQREVGDARARIAEAIGRSVDSVAIPFGYYNRTVLRQLDGYRFRRIYNSDPGPTPAWSKIVRRTPVMRHSSIEDVIDIIDDRCLPLLRARRAIAPLIKSWR